MVLKMRCVLLFFIQSLVFTMSIAQEQVLSLIALPQEMQSKIALDWDCLTICSLKCTCKDFNNTIHYDLLPITYVKKMSQKMCTKGLMQFAHVNQEKSFFHFFSNNWCKERKKGLQILGWDSNETRTIVGLMKAYKIIVNIGEGEQKKLPDFEKILRDRVASSMLCLSNKVNMKYDFSNNDTVLIWAARNGKKEMVEFLLHLPDIDPNIQNDIGDTAFIVAAGFQHTDIQALLWQHPRIDTDIQNNIGKTAIDYL